MSEKKINVALAGLSFGAEFIPIYQKHPNANLVAICQRDPKKLKELGVGNLFTPGAKLSSITDWLEAALDERETARD